ncbi:hypothetical protein H0H93_001313, partial [Arthromyces matolae]
YKTTQTSRTSDTTKTYIFYCAQLECEKKKQKEKETDPKKQRARMYMDRFPCNGYFRVTMTDERPNEARVRLTHHRTHCPYVDITVDTETVNLVKSMKNMTPSKVCIVAMLYVFDTENEHKIWDEVIRGKKTELTEKQIYAAWMRENEGEWRLADDQVKSAIRLLEKLEVGEKVDVIPLAQEDGMNTIAFALREILDRYGDEIEELAMDSTWKTNALGYELYAILGEANGQGIPVAFAFTTSTDGTAPEGAKDRMMKQVIRHVYSQCPNIRFTLSDKDISEINALRAEIPTAKHQLCYWHAIRYITERLAKNEPPAAYDPRKANAIFDFIDPTWVLGVDTDKWIEEGVREVDADTSPSRDSVVPLKIVIPKLAKVSKDNNTTTTESIDDATEEGLTSVQLEGIKEIGNSSRKAPAGTCLPPLLIVKAGDVRIPIWPSPPKVQKNDRPEFCPEEHRSPIVELFRKHLHQHSTIPLNEAKETYLTPEEIHYRAVKEIYTYCWEHNLPQAWAYMWNRWYTPKQWRLWARAACHDIPRLKTTMVVEGFWKQLKRRDLVNFNRPRLDLVTHIILTSILPRVALRLDYIQGLRRQGRPQALAGWQADFRDDWMEMSKPDELRKIERELMWLKADVKTPGRAERLAEIEEDNKRKAVRMVNKILDNRPLQDLRFFSKRYSPSRFSETRALGDGRRRKNVVDIERRVDVVSVLTHDGFLKTCITCLGKKKSYHSRRKKAKENGQEGDREDDKENNVPNLDVDSDEDDALSGLPVVDLAKFLDALATFAASEDVTSLDARVNASLLFRQAQNDTGASSVRRYVADACAQAVYEALQYKFNYHSKYDHKRWLSTRFMYHCAQTETRQHKPKKSEKDGVKHRDKLMLDTFDRSGWMHITVIEDEEMAHVRLKHMDKHIHYCCIDVPDDVKEFVKANPHLTPSQVRDIISEVKSANEYIQLWEQILKKHRKPTFSRKSIYQLWLDRSSMQWKRDPDEVTSANILIKEAFQSGIESGTAYRAEPIKIHSEEGFKAVAFALPDLLEKWGHQIRELSLDSAWNTNGSDYEVYALLGEVYGSGCPLGYVLIHSSTGDTNPGGKERFLVDLLTHMKQNWSLSPIITLTDKDFSEINAFGQVFPDAKHQLCFWHCLRAIKTRLSILRRKPKHYDVLEAMREFYDFIDKDFVPLAQARNPNPDTYVAQKAIPNLVLRIGGVRQNRAPEPTQTPRLVVKLNGVVRALVTIPQQNDPDPKERPEEDADGNLMDEVDRYYDKSGGDEIEEEDGPDFMFDKDEVTSKDPAYVFCPAVHRKQLLRMFTKHFCWHTLLPERDGKWTKETLRREAVWEMYDFCKRRGLREVWGYMWAGWYSPKMWALWARSTTPYMSRLRTTMNVENFWKQLKHDHLHHVARPRLDNLVWILIHKVTAAYVARAEILDDTYRMGRSKELTTYQKAFKKSWKALLGRQVGKNKYITLIKDFTCTCGQQKFDAHLLCKHLVQLVGLPSSVFWTQVYRRRTIPFYSHPELKPRDQSIDDTGMALLDGGITDGDDHKWIRGDVETLRGGGGWEELKKGKQVSKSRKHKLDEDSSSSPAPEVPAKRPHIDSSIIDLTNSSPAPEDDVPPIEEVPVIDLRSSSPFEYDCGDENELDIYREKIAAKAQALEKAAKILRDPSFKPDQILMKHLAEGKFGNDVVDWVNDIERFEKTERRRHQKPYYMIPGVNNDGENSDEDEEEVEIEVLGYGHCMSQHTSSSTASVQLTAKETEDCIPEEIKATDTIHEDADEETNESEPEEDASEGVEQRRVSLFSGYIVSKR